MLFKKFLISLAVLLCFVAPGLASARQNPSECSVVSVENENGKGTGWVVGKNRVLTAYHVVVNPSFEDALKGKPYRIPAITVSINGARKPAKVIKFPEKDRQDLILLEVDTSDTTPFTIASSTPIVGETLTWFWKGCDKVSHAPLKAIKRFRDKRLKGQMGFLVLLYLFDQEILVFGEQGSEMVAKGASGSPIINKKEEVVGMMTFVWGWGPSLREIRAFLIEDKK